MKREGTRWAALSLSVIFLVIGLLPSGTLFAQEGGTPSEESASSSGSAPAIAVRPGAVTETPSRYHESALRRFEIVTLTSLPFTAIHSYLIVRGVKIATEGSLAADLEDRDWNVVGAGAILLAVGIGVYDYLNMRGKDRNAPLLPESPVPRAAPSSSLAPPSPGPVLASLSVAF
ncbi:MAG: hypothetical protein KatS3mg115_1291 [Candidatus Poribacteria bacterium]|nr:MAG: hypothetical protein KatS3mg115_1291 [Candidatus Poribacteria bacterium]